jgi:hypothetical protein
MRNRMQHPKVKIGKPIQLKEHFTNGTLSILIRMNLPRIDRKALQGEVDVYGTALLIHRGITWPIAWKSHSICYENNNV